ERNMEYLPNLFCAKILQIKQRTSLHKTLRIRIKIRRNGIFLQNLGLCQVWEEKFEQFGNLGDEVDPQLGPLCLLETQVVVLVCKRKDKFAKIAADCRQHLLPNSANRQNSALQG